MFYPNGHGVDGLDNRASEDGCGTVERKQPSLFVAGGERRATKLFLLLATVYLASKKRREHNSSVV
jgi:hypothetical protein